MLAFSSLSAALLVALAAAGSPQFIAWLCDAPGSARAHLGGASFILSAPAPAGLEPASEGRAALFHGAVVGTAPHEAAITAGVVGLAWPLANTSCDLTPPCTDRRAFMRADGVYLSLARARSASIDMSIVGVGADGGPATLRMSRMPVVITHGVESSSPARSAAPFGGDWVAAPAWLSLGGPLDSGSMLAQLIAAAAPNRTAGNAIRAGFAFGGVTAATATEPTGPCPSGAPATGSLHIGGHSPGAATAIEWGEPLISPSAAARRMIFRVYDLAACGVPLMGAAGAPHAWFVDLDAESTCLTLPAPAFDALMAWAPLRWGREGGAWPLPEVVVPEIPQPSLPRLPAITFSMRPGGGVLVLPLDSLVLPGAEVEATATRPPAGGQQGAAATPPPPRLCVLRGGAAGAQTSYAPFQAASAPYAYRIRLGALALRNFYVAFEADAEDVSVGGGGRVGLGQRRHCDNVSVAVGCAAAADCAMSSSSAFFSPLNICVGTPRGGGALTLSLLAAATLTLAAADAWRHRTLQMAVNAIAASRRGGSDLAATATSVRPR